jgi:DNA primase
MANEIPESREISELVRQEVKTAEVSEYGSERLPSGPNIDSYEAIVLVEGRADVINLLKSDINNVVAIGGANITKSIIALCREKEITVFLDGDRGGDIILRELVQATDIDYVARAPNGKEVEELTRKEIIKCLRNRAPIEQVEGVPKPRREEQRVPLEIPNIAKIDMPQRIEEQVQLNPPEILITSLNELENTLRARLYDEQLNLKSEIPVRDLIKTLSESESIYAIVLDGVTTQRLVDLAESKGVKMLIGVKMGNIFRKPDSMLISAK